MEAKKIKLEAVEAGTIAFDLCKKEFTKAVDLMHTNGYNSPALAVPFYIYLEQQFKGKKKPLMLMTLGLRKQPWTLYINKKKKDSKEKKKMLVGTCFLENAAGKYILRLNPDVGSAKMNLIEKGGRELFKKAKVTVGLAAGAVIPEEGTAAETSTEEPTEAPKTNLAPLENDIKTKWSVIVSNFRGLSAMTNKAEKAKSSLMLFGSLSQLEKIVANYESQGGNIAALPPSYTKNLGPMKEALSKSPRIQAMQQEAASIKARLEHLNAMLREAGLPSIQF